MCTEAFALLIVAMVTGDGGSGGAEKEWLLCTAGGREAKVSQNCYFGSYAISNGLLSTLLIL